MTDRELLKQVLEALVAAYQGKDKTGQVTEAITALRERLAQPEQEPVLYVDPNLDRVCTDKKLAAKYGLYIPLYAKPQSAAKGDNL